MMVIPDTNVWIKMLSTEESPVKARFRQTEPDHIYFCSIVKAELYFGAYNSAQKAKNLNMLERLFQNYGSLPFDDASSRIYGEVRAELKARGTPIGPNDMLIAAVALRHDAVLITHNIREFSRIETLRLEDWEKIQE